MQYQNQRGLSAAAAAPCIKSNDRPSVSLAEEIYVSLKEELLHVKIHRNQIFREYERHRARVEVIEEKLNSVSKNVRMKYDIDLEKYAPLFSPTYEEILHDVGESCCLMFVSYSHAFHVGQI